MYRGMGFLGSEPKFAQPEGWLWGGATRGVAAKLVSDPNNLNAKMQKSTGIRCFFRASQAGSAGYFFQHFQADLACGDFTQGSYAGFVLAFNLGGMPPVSYTHLRAHETD